MVWIKYCRWKRKLNVWLCVRKRNLCYFTRKAVKGQTTRSRGWIWGIGFRHIIIYFVISACSVADLSTELWVFKQLVFCLIMKLGVCLCFLQLNEQTFVLNFSAMKTGNNAWIFQLSWAGRPEYRKHHCLKNTS